MIEGEKLANFNGHSLKVTLIETYLLFLSGYVNYLFATNHALKLNRDTPTQSSFFSTKAN